MRSWWRRGEAPRPSFGPGVTNEAAVGLPPLSISRKATWDYYRIEFLPDGYPGRRTDEALHPHPIYGSYVITDYVGQFRRTGDHAYLDAAHRVATAAIGRMTDRDGALVFEYEPGTVSSLPEAFYSGLTQGRYLGALSQLMTASDRPGQYAEATKAILRSFEIPAERGGVARTTPGGGLLIEEYAHRVPDYTLNGWTTTTLLLHKYAAATGDEYAADLFSRSVRGIADVLPLYDVPELANTRYRLAGHARFRLTFSRPGAIIGDAAVVIPGQGEFPVDSASTSGWDNRFVRGVDDRGAVEGRRAVLDALLSRVTWPAPNVIRANITVPEATVLRVEVGEGDYLPLRSRLKAERFTTIFRQRLNAGQTSVEVPVPWERAELVAYPTNFAKKIDGRQFNVYHFIHVDTVGELASITGGDLLTYYGARWAEYPLRWPTIEPYASSDIELDRYAAQ